MGQALSVLDNLFLQLETPTTPMHVGGLLVFEPGSGPIDVDRLYDVMLRTPASTSPFNWRLQRPRLGVGRHRWQRLDATSSGPHLGRATVSSPGGDAELMAAVSRLHTAPIDRRQPMWECHLIDGLASGRCAIYYKVHHACIDGVSGIRRMQEGLSQVADEATPPIWASERKRSRSARQSRPLAELRAGTSAISELARGLMHVAGGALTGDRHRSAAPYVAPDTVLNQMLSGERSVAWHRLPMARVRALGKAAGATVNEIALALCSTVLRAHLLERGDLPARPLVAMVPLSLRDAGGGREGNQVSCILCNLATDEADPVRRLETIVASSSDGKRLLREMSPAAAGAYWLALTTPAILAQLAGVVRRAPLPFNVVVSNVPGPRQQLYYNGARLRAIYPASLLFERQALNFTLVSYRDELDVGLLSCRRTIPDLPRLATMLGDAMDELESAVLGSPQRSAGFTTVR